MKSDMKMFRAKLSELMSMCGPEEDADEGYEEKDAVEPQDGQSKAGAEIDDGGQESIETAGVESNTSFMGMKDPEEKKKMKLDVIVASMKKKMGK